MVYIGQAYDLKTVSVDMVTKRVKRTGDRCIGDQTLSSDHHFQNNKYNTLVWVWNDGDMENDQTQNANDHYIS